MGEDKTWSLVFVSPEVFTLKQVMLSPLNKMQSLLSTQAEWKQQSCKYYNQV